MKIIAGKYPEEPDWDNWISFTKGPGINLVFLYRLAAYVRDVVKAKVNMSGFRTYEQQQAAYADYLAGGNLAAKPGNSWHEYGLAVDFQRISTVNGIAKYPGTLNADYLLFEQGKPESLLKYGICHTVKTEPWHIQPIETKGYTGVKANFADDDDLLNGGETMLSRGDNGNDVLYWQKSLVKAGFPLIDSTGAIAEPNGNFGPATEGATKKYQTSVGLAATGIVDTATFAQMCNTLSHIYTYKAELDAAKLKIASLTVDLNNAKALTIQAENTLKNEQDRAQKLRDAIAVIKSY